MATDTDSIILSISADTKQIQRAMAKLQGDTQRGLKGMENSFGGVDRAARRTATVVADAGTAVSRSMRSTNQQTANLSFQLNDIAQGLLSGTSPFTIMIQQGGQVSQVMQQISASGGGMARALLGAFSSLINPITLLSFALIAAAGYAVQYFTAVDEGSGKADKELQKHIDALQRIAKSYGDLAPEVQQTLDAITFQNQADQDIKELNASINILRTDSVAKLLKAFTDVGAAVDSTAATDKLAASLGMAEATKQFSAMQARVDGLNKALEEGRDPAGDIMAILAALDSFELAAPNAGFGAMADRIRTEVIPLLEKVDDRQKAVVLLQQAIKDATDGTVESQKAFNKAMETMRDIAAPAMSAFDKMWKAYREGVIAAQGDIGKLRDLQNGLINGLDDLADAANIKLGEGLATDLEGFAAKVAAVESGGSTTAKNPKSSASGLFQFIDDTFVAMVRKLPGYEAASRDVILAQKNNVDLQKKAFDELVKENSAALAKAGIPVTDATRYLAHFLGSQGAIDIISGKRGPNAAEIKANPFLAGMSGQEVVRWAEKKMGGARASVNTQDARDKAKADQEDAQIQGEITKAYDEQAAKQAEELSYAQQIRDLKKQAAEEGRGVSVEEMQNAREIAKLAGETAGRKEGAKKAEAASKTYEGRLQALKDSTEALQLEAEQLNISGQAQDQDLVKREAAIEALKIENDLKRAGVDVTAAMSAAILSSATAHQNAKVAIDEYNKTAKDTKAATEEFAKQMGGLAKSAIGGFIADMRAGKSAGEAFNNMINRIIDSLIDMALEAAFSADNMKALFSGMGGGAGGGGGGGLLGLFGKLFGGVGGSTIAAGIPGPWGASLAKGGIVGDRNNPMVQMNPRDFAGARSYQRGGFPGMPPGAIPIYAHPGEMVIPKSLVGKGGSGTKVDNSVNNQLGPVSIDMAGSGMVAAGTQQAKQFGENVRALIAQEMVRESRPGGLLRPGSGSAMRR